MKERRLINGHGTSTYFEYVEKHEELADENDLNGPRDAIDVHQGRRIRGRDAPGRGKFRSQGLARTLRHPILFALQPLIYHQSSKYAKMPPNINSPQTTAIMITKNLPSISLVDIES